MVKILRKRLPGGSLRLPLIVLTACLALAAVFAEGFVFTSLDHDCTGEHCSVCLQIEIAQNLLKGLGRIGLFALAACLIPQTTLIIKSRLSLALAPQTLVGLKTKYNS
ncbi:hypothetical protein FACS189479_00160 [Spirochaetia bacterium]|nr:hypothetical protein FACS189479_00160 [Spirochaetia bacterium]